MNFDFVTDIFIQVAQFIAGLEPWQQIFGLMLAGMIPFIESYLGSFIGMLLGVHPLIVIPAAVVGNIIITFALIAIAGKTRGAVTKNRDPKELSKSKQKITKYLDRFGVPGVCFLGPLVLASQITAPVLIGLGAKKASVYLYTGLSIIAWGILFGVFGEALVRLLM